MFVTKLALRSGLNDFHDFIETEGTINNQMKDEGFIQGMSAMLAAVVTPNIGQLLWISK